jgi:murein DD-endopeptidase MepM/ murein hydrolase activator NlpD
MFADAALPRYADPNLFDGRLSIFYWKPSSVLETSIGQLAANLRAAAPNLSAVVVKTTNGLGWQGKWDGGKPNLAILGLADVQRWVDELGVRGLECHAWCTVRGNTPARELDRLADICLRGGVRSLLLGLQRDPPDTRPSQRSFFVGDRATAETLATGLRQRVGPAFHLGLIFDASEGQPQSVYVQSAWFPEIDSLHPLVYHHELGLSPRAALAQTFQALGRWGKPIYPVLQAFGVPAAEVAEVVGMAADAQQVPGLSLFRYGTGSGQGLSQAELARVAGSWPAAPTAVARTARSVTRPSKAAAEPVQVQVDPDDERGGLFAIGYYGDPARLSRAWTRDRDANGLPRLYRPASFNKQTLYVAYAPRLLARGTYQLEVFVPRNHAYARDVHYFVVDYPRGERRETLAILDQQPHNDEWVTLHGNVVSGPGQGEPVNGFELDPAFDDAGRVNVADITFLDPATHPAGRFEVSFAAVRWRPVNPAPVPGFDSPVGTPAERAGPLAEGRRLGPYALWCGNWYDANPIGTRYWLGNRWAVHTGADLNLEGPGGVLADKDAPVYAAAAGRAVFAGFVSSGWKNVVVVEHPLPEENRVIYARYAHLGRLLVGPNEVVARGQQLATIGKYAPSNYHLHFDLTYDPILKTVPGHWPGDNAALVRRMYVDPREFVRQRHRVRG